MTEALSPKIIEESSITADFESKSFYPGGKGFSLTYDFNSSGNLVAVLYLRCRNNRNEDFKNCNNASFPTQPAGTSGDDEYSLCDPNHKEYQVFVDFTSGDGELNVYLNIVD